MNIKILALDFEVKEVDVIDKDYTLIGQIDHVKNIIYICSDLAPEKKKIVLLHEALHSIFEQLGFNAEHDNEHLIDSIATSIYQLAKDNKNLF